MKLVKRVDVEEIDANTVPLVTLTGMRLAPSVLKKTVRGQSGRGFLEWSTCVETESEDW